MTGLVCKPEKAPVVKGRGLYEVYMNRKPLGLHVRAKNAAEADAMIQFVFEHELTDKHLDFNLDDFRKLENFRKERDNGKDQEGATEAAEAAEDSGAADPAPPREEA